MFDDRIEDLPELKIKTSSSPTENLPQTKGIESKSTITSTILTKE